MFTKLKVVGISVAVLGDSLGRTPDCESFSYMQTAKGVYKRLARQYPTMRNS
jgi:nitrite reductase (NADH) large subunit